MAKQKRVWFITGCSSGFGRALAEAVIAHGDHLVATARRLSTIADLVAQAPHRVLTLALDVTKPDSVQVAIAAAITRFNVIDVLVNNAGYGLQGAIEEISDAEARQQFETNVFGVWNVLRAALPHLRQAGGGHILNFSSIAGQRASPGLGGYSASKFAVEGLSEALAQEVAPLGIRVTLVEPGGFRTDWAGRSMVWAAHEIKEYAATSGRLRQGLKGFHGRQAGDPARAAQALLALVELPEPPLRLPLGPDALQGIRSKLKEVERDISAQEALSLSTNFQP
ncbi:oxidoreductase [Hymenobacter terrenus]|uniref:oxidoreductase n=1 Tax=Hymenobacter terrenus TaxID=1629124 RepID=UPI0006199A5C|nr:oxidoreductase [Hymenobacter terrenus]